MRFRPALLVLAAVASLGGAVVCSQRHSSRDEASTSSEKQLLPPDGPMLKRPSELHAWPVLPCASSGELLALKAGQNVCVKGEALWHDQGAVMCDGLVHLNSPGLPNRFMDALWRLSERDLHVKCPSCDVYALHEEGVGELDVCIKVTEAANGPERSLTAILSALNDVAVTRIEKQRYYYRGPESRGSVADLLSVEVPAASPARELRRSSE